MKIQIVHRGDKDYAYACTSKRIKGKDNPTLIRRYLGTLDPETGLVTPKKVPPETFLAQIHDDEFTCTDLGNVLIAKSVAESLGIPGTLERFFGDDYRIVYALALAISVHPTYSSEYLDYVNNYHLEDVIGKSRITARDIDDIRDLGFPVFSRTVAPCAGEPKGYGGIGIEITVGGQRVRTGDWIVGDESGIMVIPKEVAVEVANRALDVHERENRTREEILRGSTLSKVNELAKWEPVK